MTNSPESRIDDLEMRVGWIEKYLQGQSIRQPVTPPPIVSSPQPVSVQETQRNCWRCGKPTQSANELLCPSCLANVKLPPIPQVTFTQRAPKEEPDTEFILGARLLPRIGAVLVLLGLAYFAGWAYTNGLITPWMAFLGEVGASFSFLAMGFGLSKTKEQFGEILKAVGSAGLFTSFAAGHLYHHVFNAEAMLGGCLLVSVANMGFATAAKSRTFWGLGLIGGFITAFLPTTQRDFASSEALYSLVMATALVTAGMQKWIKAILGAWTVYLLPQLVLAHTQIPWMVRIGHLEGVSLLAVLAFVFAFYEGNSFDPNAWSPKVMGIGAGLLGFYVQSGELGSLHVSILGVAIGALALIASAKPTLQRSLLFTAGALLFVLAPFGLTIWHTSALMIALAWGLLIAEYRLRKVELCWLAAFEIVAASSMALFRYDLIANNVHIWLNAAMLLTLVPLSLAFRRYLEEDSPIFAGHALAGLFFASRIGVSFDHNNPPFGMPLTIAWTAYGLALLVMGLWTKVKDVRIAGILVLLLTLFKVVFYDLGSVELIAKVAVLTGLGVAILIGGYLVIRIRGKEDAE